MKLNQIIAIAAGAVSMQPLLDAATITTGLPDPVVGGVGYFAYVTMGATDSGTFTNHVGAWSWADETIGGPTLGWTHTSNWVALTLTAPSIFTLRHEVEANVPWPSAGNPGRLADTDNMNPSFTLYSGQDQDGGDADTYYNQGNVSWAEDITYMDHIDNSSVPVVERSWTLPAGNYTIVLGSNAAITEDDTNRQGYRATFTTAPVPEPTTAALLVGALATLGLRRRRS